jgi:hypothetical protein
LPSALLSDWADEMPNVSYSHNELVGLSYTKVCDLLLRQLGWVIWQSIDASIDGVYAEPFSNPGKVYVRGPTPWESDDTRCNYWVPPESDLACPWPGMEGDQLLHDLPEGMTGIQLTDGSNMVILGRYPNSDEIRYSKSWYHSVDTGFGQKLGEMIVKAVVGSATFGLSNFAIAAFNKDAVTPNRPIFVDVPDQYKDQFQPSVMSPVDPSGAVSVQNPVDNLQPVAQPATVQTFPWVGAGVALLALLGS